MYDIAVHCIEAFCYPRYKLRGGIESAGTCEAPSYLCHLHDSLGIQIVIGRLDEAPRAHEPAPAFASRCVAAALLVRPTLEPLPASGQGAVVLRHDDAVCSLAFGFANGRLSTGADLTRGVSLIGSSSYWQLAEMVLSIVGGSGGDTWDARKGCLA